jgi:putative PIN family toxin of toxin-antitoxin system
MKFIVIDASVWIRMARSAYAAPLIDRIVLYQLMPVLNSYLLSEVHDALLKNKWATVKQAEFFIDYIKKLSFYVTENVVFRLSPDPKDNYLFDLAVQYNCPFIVSDDTVLLSFLMQPVKVKSCNWFLKYFPVQ